MLGTSAADPRRAQHKLEIILKLLGLRKVKGQFWARGG